MPRLPREAVAAPSLAVFKAWSNLGWWKMFLLMAGRWNEMVYKVPSNPNHSMILFYEGRTKTGEWNKKTVSEW